MNDDKTERIEIPANEQFMCIAADNKYAIFGTHDRLLMCNLADKKYLERINIKGYWPDGLALSPNYKSKAAVLRPFGSAAEVCVRIWHNNKTFDIKHNIVHSLYCKVYFTPDCKQLVMTGINFVIVDLDTLEIPKQTVFNNQTRLDVVTELKPVQDIILSYLDRSREEQQLTEVKTGYTSWLKNMSFSAVNNIRTSCSDRELTITDAQNQPLQTIGLHETMRPVICTSTKQEVLVPTARERIACTTLSHSGKYLAIGYDRTIAIWKLASELIYPTDEQYEDDTLHKILPVGTHAPPMPSYSIAK